MKKINFTLLLVTIFILFSSNMYQDTLFNMNSNSSKLSPRLSEYIKVRNDEKYINITLFIDEFDYSDVFEELGQNYDYLDDNQNLIPKKNLDYMEDMLNDYSNTIAKFQVGINERFINSIPFDFDILFQSIYTPFISIRIPRENLDYFINDNRVHQIYLSNAIKTDKVSLTGVVSETDDPFCLIEFSCGGGLDPDPYNNINEQTGMITVGMEYAHNNLDMSLNGPTIGIIDEGLVANSSGFSDNVTNLISNEGNINFINDHSTFIAMLIGSTNGMSPNSEIYAIAGYSENGYAYEIERLHEQGAQIINMSMTSGVCDNSYDSSTQYIDYISRVHNITFFKSSGNNLCSSKPNAITNPGLANNIITVGGTTQLGKTFWEDSGYNENNQTLAFKPNVVAPAIGYDFTYSPYEEYVEGTSLSAANVTGSISLLVQHDPSLLIFPDRIAAIVMGSSSTYPLTSHGFQLNLNSAGLDNKIGAGLIDIERMFNLSGEEDFSYYKSVDNYVFSPISKTVHLSAGDKITIICFWERYVTDQSLYEVVDLNLKLQFNGTVANSSSIYNNSEKIEYIALQDGNYNIVIEGPSNINDSISQFSGHLVYIVEWYENEIY